jgi:hypothetical protein
MTIRIIGALAALISAGIHLWEYFGNGYDETGVGVPFLINGIGGVLIVILLLTWRHWIPLLLLFGFGALSLAGYLLAATVGLLGVTETWDNAAGWISMIVEAVAIVVAVLAGVREGYLSRRTRPSLPVE